jgi:hypothetical protein
MRSRKYWRPGETWSRIAMAWPFTMVLGDDRPGDAFLVSGRNNIVIVRTTAHGTCGWIMIRCRYSKPTINRCCTRPEASSYSWELTMNLLPSEPRALAVFAGSAVVRILALKWTEFDDASAAPAPGAGGGCGIRSGFTGVCGWGFVESFRFMEKKSNQLVCGQVVS